MDAVVLRKALGQEVRKRRRALGYSQEAFAEEVGIHRTYMGAVERGERNVSLTNLVRLANALDMRLSALIAASERRKTR